MKKKIKKQPKKQPKKPKAKKIQSIDLYDADHPLRRTAIEIIENIIEPLMQRGINGERYYKLEDDLTLTMNKRLLRFLKKPIIGDIKKQNKLKLNENRNPDCDFDPYGAHFDIDENDEENFDDNDDDNNDFTLGDAYENILGPKGYPSF